MSSSFERIINKKTAVLGGGIAGFMFMKNKLKTYKYDIWYSIHKQNHESWFSFKWVNGKIQREVVRERRGKKDVERKERRRERKLY